jgi:acetylornithine deacetylase/succinyl-diaminopimelate desuccinylase-like protein
MDQVVACLEENKQRNVELFEAFLRIPSISTDAARKQEMHQAAEWVGRFFTDCGIDGEIIETAGHPVVFADTGPVVDGGTTVLVYGHYDVQPTGDESLWDSPAFEPSIRNGVMYGRGSADDKGQVLTHMLAAESWMKVAGKTPVRVKFLIEGEEEVGSPSLIPLVREHRERLACDYVALSDTAKLDADTPAITYGTKGIVYKEITLYGPEQDLHSGSFGGTVTNPGNALAAILASLRDEDGRVTIPGFYDDVRELSPKEKAAMAELPFDENDYLATLRAPALTGEKGYTTLERRWVRPTLDVNGLFGGFTGEGQSTIIPSKMMAKVSMRLVPDQVPEKIARIFDKAVRAAAPRGVRIEINDLNACAPYVSPIDSPGMVAATKGIEAGFGRKPVLIREGGSLPILPKFKEILGADSLMMGFCVPNCNAHGPNEFFSLQDFYNGAKAAACFLHYLATGK